MRAGGRRWLTAGGAPPGIVRSKVNAGKRVHLVDQYSALATADLIDGIHPTATGYDKMAAVWYRALQAVPGSIGTPGGGGGTHQNVQLVGAGPARCLDASGRGTADGTRINLWDCHGGSNQRWRVRA
ncbi:ricin-type beta-trefoil lectin domain protein [Micromonospora sp. WMMB482]|uniref:ricin-type beta-trefoil lectin domain protein n=1 Tax=Micromonospora sp. WMMB482 TaxID=2849653 RepID=UPI0035B35DF9